MQLVLLDDNEGHNALLHDLITQVVESEQLDMHIALCTTSVQDVLDFARGNGRQAAYLMDIELEQTMNGIDVCNLIHACDPGAYIVYVSAHQHYALTCLKSHAYDFLLKPFTKAELAQCLSALAYDQKSRPLAAGLQVKIGARTIVLDPMDIQYFQVDRNTVTAQTAQGKYCWRDSFQALWEKLDPAMFLRVHRSIIANRTWISEVDWVEDRLTLRSGAQLPIARRMRRHLRDTLQAKVR